jgi:hypothetical protein
MAAVHFVDLTVIEIDARRLQLVPRELDRQGQTHVAKTDDARACGSVLNFFEQGGADSVHGMVSGSSV